MADRYGQRISGIGAGDLHPGQQPRNHGVDLRLFGITDADHRLFDQPRGIFADVDPHPRGAEQHHAAGLAELERRLRVLVYEDFLDGDAVDADLRDERFELAGKVGEPLRQRRGRVRLQLAVSDVGKAVALGLNDPPAGRAEPGIETEDDQPSFSSSSSGTS